MKLNNCFFFNYSAQNSLEHWVYFSPLNPHTIHFNIPLILPWFPADIKVLKQDSKVVPFCWLKTNMIYVQTLPLKLILEDKPKHLELEGFIPSYCPYLYLTKLTSISRETSHSSFLLMDSDSFFILLFLVSDKIFPLISHNFVISLKWWTS